MERIRIIVATMFVCLCVGSNQPSADETVAIDLTQWTAPDIRKVGEDSFGALVKYGQALFTDTANEIGPEVADPTKRFAGNNLACQSCHLQGGTKAYAMPMVGGANIAVYVTQ
jgi:thiosulfate dehydrogenase